MKRIDNKVNGGWDGKGFERGKGDIADECGVQH